jgi:hypothetical protein
MQADLFMLCDSYDAWQIVMTQSADGILVSLEIKAYEVCRFLL